jgi:hypothetical protein
LLDLDSLAAVSAAECLSLPWDRKGEGWAHRCGEWFRRDLARIEKVPEANPVYRKNGVYLVIGGAGGIGEVWSRFMMEHYQARIVWIGRRERSGEIEAKINALARLGTPPLYVAADATNLEAVRQAMETVSETYPVIHGVVHSGIVLDCVLHKATRAVELLRRVHVQRQLRAESRSEDRLPCENGELGLLGQRRGGRG